MTCPARRASQFVSILASFKLHDVGEMMQARSKRQVEWEQISIEKSSWLMGRRGGLWVDGRWMHVNLLHYLRRSCCSIDFPTLDRENPGTSASTLPTIDGVTLQVLVPGEERWMTSSSWHRFSYKSFNYISANCWRLKYLSDYDRIKNDKRDFSRRLTLICF